MTLEDEIKPFSNVIEFPIFAGTTYVWEKGWGNGYIHLPPHHKYHGMSDEQLPVNVHGGITYSKSDDEGINWVIGFDTFHSSDTIKNGLKKE